MSVHTVYGDVCILYMSGWKRLGLDGRHCLGVLQSPPLYPTPITSRQRMGGGVVIMKSLNFVLKKINDIDITDKA